MLGQAVIHDLMAGINASGSLKGWCVGVGGWRARAPCRQTLTKLKPEVLQYVRRKGGREGG
jgi:hypothetical protein